MTREVTERDAQVLKSMRKMIFGINGVGVRRTPQGIALPDHRHMRRTAGAPSAKAKTGRFKVTAVEDDYVEGTEIGHDATVLGLMAKIAKHERLRGSTAPDAYAVDDVVVATFARNGTGVNDTDGAQINWLAVTLAVKSDDLDTIGTTAETETAQTDSWDRSSQAGKAGVVATKLYRVAYDKDGDEVFYAFYRDETYDSDGNLALIDAEASPVTIFDPKLCN